MQIPDSNAIDGMAQEVRVEYDRLLTQTRFELANIEGMETITMMVLERFCFLYAALRQMERHFAQVDVGRYNQLTQIWVKIAGSLMSDLKGVFSAGALNDVFVSKIMTIVTEEVTDSETLNRIRSRIATAAREETPSI